MKKAIILLTTGFFLFVLFSCGESPEKIKQKAEDLASTKTLGLAYLEEFKLEDAEKAFQKFIKLAPKDKFGYANLGLTYLRMAKYPEAEKELQHAIKIDPEDPDIMLILATVYQMSEQREKAIKVLKDALTFAPDHIKILYNLSELYTAGNDEQSQKDRLDCLKKLVDKAPGNIVPYLNITDMYIKQDSTDNALHILETIQKLFPEFPKEAVEYFDKTVSLLRKADSKDALVQFTIFHNYMKVTSTYQAGIMDLKGPGGSLIGFPVITFDQQSSPLLEDHKAQLEAIKFTNVTSTSGLGIIPLSDKGGNDDNRLSAFADVSDYDGDGDGDIYIGSYDPSSSSYKHYLMNNELGSFSEVSGEAGIKITGNETGAAFGDYDNDGFMDLYILRGEGDVLYRNNGKGGFDDVTSKAEIGSKKGGNRALFVDLDHDGDLDVFEACDGHNLVFRNNADGTFQEQGEKMGLAGGNLNTLDAAFGDFDDDDDIDLFVVNENGSNALYSNQRQGVFRDITEEAGLKSSGGSNSVTVADYNNDGFLDLFVTSLDGAGSVLYRNNGEAVFEVDKNTKTISEALKNIEVHDARFFDFDNDGHQDLIVVGEPKDTDGKGIVLFRNDGQGNLKLTSDILPEEPRSGKQVSVFDYNEDGDLDVVIAGINGGAFLLRNDGGNNNHFIKMQLFGLRAGSAKNNHFGIGAKVEMRAGDLYQTMVVTDPEIVLGLGSKLQADAIRITWTNGVPQNIFFPATDQSLIEAQTLKGSCPFLYTWDGNEYTFAKDILWRSALGMPLGIMGGTKAYAFADASDDYIKIPGSLLKPKDGKYKMQVTSELWETIYFDKLQLIAVDHPDSVDIYVPEQFSPPPFPGMKIYRVGKKHFPASAIDGEGNDLLSCITNADDRYIANFNPGKYQGITEMHDLILDPGEISGNGKLWLFLYGWIFPTDASINVALSQSHDLKAIQPFIQVRDSKGKWVTVVDNMGFPMGKDKMVIVDLSGKFLSSDHHIKISTNMQIYWDQVFFTDRLSTAPVTTTVMDPASADIHFRGFSAEFRKGGRYGPHWFDYSRVDTNRKWIDLKGNYTRYGDVLPLLKESDNMYIISNAGDETSVAFNTDSLPEIKKGWTRDFLIHSVGWVKDGDINTAESQKVTPLPYHGMKSYPPSASDSYPDNPGLKKYNREYNTRVVTDDYYLNALKIK
jgi:Tfp pilus assembly protein PilF